MSLKIKKRGGDDSSFNPQKIYNRIKRASKGLSVNSDEIFIKVITSVPTEGIITTKELDKLIYEIAAAFTGSHHDYSRLASSVAISSYHKETNSSFSETMSLLYNDGIIHEKLIETIKEYGEDSIDAVINHDNDYMEVTEWSNGEGFDINISDKSGDRTIAMTFGEYDALKKLIKFLNKQDL